MFYFAYGSNMSLRRIRQRVPSARKVSVAVLAQHKLKFHKRGSRDGSGKCDIVMTGQETDKVFGVVFDIDEGEKTALDAAEGLHNGYEIKEIALLALDGCRLQAFAYYGTDLDESLQPFHWYKNHVLQGALENGLPESYTAMIREVVSVDDPVGERHLAEMNIHIHEE